MTITEIRKIGKGQRYELVLDELQKFVFEAEIFVKYKLKTGDEIDSETLHHIQLENGELSAFDRALTYLEKNMKTEKGIREYLKQKGFLEETIDITVEKLKSYGYIDDAGFAECYIRTYQGKKGKKKLKYELLSKGVDSSIIDEKLEEFVNDDEEFETCKLMLKKYMKNKEYDLKTKQKAVAHLVGKGFSFNMINKAIGEDICEQE